MLEAIITSIQIEVNFYFYFLENAVCLQLFYAVAGGVYDISIHFQFVLFIDVSMKHATRKLNKQSTDVHRRSDNEIVMEKTHSLHFSLLSWRMAVGELMAFGAHANQPSGMNE